MTTPSDASLARLLATAKDGESSEALGAAYELSEALERAGGELPTAAIVEYVTAWAAENGAPATSPCFMSDRPLRYLHYWAAPVDHEGRPCAVLERGPIQAAGGDLAFYARASNGALISVTISADGSDIGASLEGPDGKKYGGIDWPDIAPEKTP